MTLTMKVWDWQSESDLYKIRNSCFYSLSASIFIQWWSKLRVTFLLFRTSFQTEAERGCVKCSKSGITLWRPLVTDVRRKGGGVGVQQEGLLVPSKAKSGEQPAWNWAHITRSPFLSTFCTVLYVAIWRQTTNGKCIVIEVWGSSNIVLSKN